MKMSGERIIPAPRSRVWEALNDPDVLKQSIPGCIELVKHSPTQFSAKVMAKVGPVKATFAGEVTLSNLNPAHSYVITGKGTGGVAGFAEGSAEVRLEDTGGQTRLIYDVDATVGGKLAQIGSRLIESTARRMADEFFNRFAEVVTMGEAQAVALPETTESTPEVPVESAPGPAAISVARKAVAGKTKTARKAVAKTTAARKSVAAKPGRRSPGEVAEQLAPTAAQQAMQSPSLRPQATVAAPSSASRQEKLGQPTPQPPQQPWMENNLWLLVGAGVVALLVIVLLANV
jgi:carbon monoxide dehydrogenase subunit G